MNSMYVGLGISCALAALGVGLLLYARKERALQAVMLNTPITPITQLAAGQYAAIQGTATKAQTPLIAPCTDIPCLCYSYQMEERVREVRDGRETDEWRTIDRQSQRTPFLLTDATGGIEVNVESASLDMVRVYSGPPVAVAPAGSGVMGQIAEAAADIARVTGAVRPTRVSVSAIPLNHDLYILGEVQQDASGHLMVAKAKKTLFISARSEGEVVRSAGLWSGVCFVLGPALMAGGVLLAWACLTGRFFGHR